MAYNEKTKQTTIAFIDRNLDAVRFWVQKGELNALKALAHDSGYSAYSRYIIDAVNEKAGYNVLTMPRERKSKKTAK